MTTDDRAQVGDTPCVGAGVPLQWEDACIQYSIDQRGSIWMSMEDIEDAVTASFETWQTVNCGASQEPPNVVFQMGPASLCREAEFNGSRLPNVNTIAFLDPWVDEEGEPLNPAIIAVTNVFFSDDGRILDADMLINETLGPYDLCPDSGCPGRLAANRPFDLQNIVTHEAGHLLGIGHSDIEEATMYFQSPRGETSKRTLAPDDISAICTIYAPGNLNANCDSTPIGGLDLNCEDALPEPTSNSGCSSTTLDGAHWTSNALLGLFALVSLTVSRRRSSRRGERC